MVTRLSPYAGNRLPGRKVVVRERLRTRLAFTTALVITALMITALVAIALG